MFEIFCYGLACFLAGGYAASYFKYGHPVSITDWISITFFILFFGGTVVWRRIAQSKGD